MVNEQYTLPTFYELVRQSMEQSLPWEQYPYSNISISLREAHVELWD